MAKKIAVNNYNLSQECRSCRLVISNGGKCYGKPWPAKNCIAYCKKRE